LGELYYPLKFREVTIESVVFYRKTPFKDKTQGIFIDGYPVRIGYLSVPNFTISAKIQLINQIGIGKPHFSF